MASAETDKIKAMMNQKYGPGTVKYGSELPPIQNPFKDFEERNPAAEGGRMRFDNGLSAKQKKAKGDLTKGILQAYKDLGKGKNTTTVDIYNKIKDLDVFKDYNRRDLLVTIGKRLRTNNKPYTKTTPATSDAFEETKQAKRKIYLDKPVDQPTLVYQSDTPGKAGKIMNIKFPETGNNTKANFKKAIDNYYSIPKDDAKIKVAKNKIIKDFFPDGLSNNQWNKLVGFFNKEEDIDTKRPYLYGDEGGSQLKSRENRKSRKEEFSDKIFEDRISDEKRNIIKDKGLLKNPNFKAGYEPIDLAHRLSLGTSKRFGIQQKTGTIGLDRQVVNQVFVEYYQSKLNKVYNLQKDLIANKPKDFRKKLEAGNKLITSIVNDADNRIVGVTIDEKTLKPRLFGDKFAAKYAIDQGLFDKEIKNLKSQDKEFIKKFLLQDQVMREVDTGLDVKNFKNINKDSITKWMNKTDKFKNSEIKQQALKILEDNPQITKSEGVLGTKNSQPQIKKLIESIGCPVKGKVNLLAQGGRTGFAEGGDCFDKGQKLINSGMKGASQASMRNFSKFANSALKLGRNVMKFGVIPEAMFIGAESLVRMGMGDTLSEASKQAVGFYLDPILGTNFAKEGAFSKMERDVGTDMAFDVAKLNEYNESLAKVEKLKSAKEQTLAVNDESLTGQTDQEVTAQYDKFIANAQTELNKKMLTETERVDFENKADTAKDVAGVKSPIRQFIGNARSNTELMRVEDDPTGMQSDMIAPEVTQKDLNKKRLPQKGMRPGLSKFVNFDDRQLEQLSGLTKKPFKELKDYQDYLNNERKLSFADQERIFGKEQTYGTQGNFFGEKINEKPMYDYAEGGITGLRSKYEYKK